MMGRDLVEFVLEEFAEKAPRSFDASDVGGNVAGQVRDTERSLGVEWLRTRGENWSDHGDRLGRLYEDQTSARKAKARYAKTARGRETRRSADATYRTSEKSRERYEKWNAKRRERRAAAAGISGGKMEAA